MDSTESTEATAPEPTSSAQDIPAEWLAQTAAKLGFDPVQGDSADLPTEDVGAEPPAAEAEPEGETEAPEPPKAVKDSDWITYRKQKDRLRAERKEHETAAATLKSERDKLQSERDAEAAALASGDFDGYFQERFGVGFNEITARYAQQQRGIDPAARKEMAEAKKLAADVAARTEKLESREREIAKSQSDAAHEGQITAALKSGNFGDDAKALAEDPQLAAALRRLAHDQIDPEEDQATQTQVFKNIVKTVVDRQRANYELLSKVFGAKLTEERETAPEPGGTSYLGTEHRGTETVGNRAPKPKTKTISNRTATPVRNKTAPSADDFSDIESFMSAKRRA